MKNRQISGLLALSLVSLVSGCSSSGGDGTGEAAIVCGDGTDIYVRVDGDDSNPGMIALPLKTIRAAVDCGQPGQTVRVANGTYQVGPNSANTFTESVWLEEGISIYGGYSSDFQARAPDTYPTIIEDTTDMSLIGYNITEAVLVRENTTPGTVLDGFTIKGTTVGIGDYAYGINIQGAATISNNVINGGGGFGIESSAGIRMVRGVNPPVGEETNTNPKIIHNTIYGGNSDGSVGILSTTDGPITILNNSIDGGNGKYSTGIHITELSSDGSIISDNIIDGGGGSAKINSTGISLLSPPTNYDQVVVESNTIYVNAENSGLYNWGMDLNFGAPIIRNNTIIVSVDLGRAIGILNTSDAIISNNTIFSSGSNEITGIQINEGKFARIQNNIIELAGGTCIKELTLLDSDPLALKNNDLTGCTTLYRDNDTTDIADIVDVNDIAATDASGNVSISPLLDDVDDYRLTDSSPAIVTQGGVDLSSDFNTDKADAPRTAPWSMGAYEYD